jgi:hypothetical protein
MLDRNQIDAFTLLLTKSAKAANFCYVYLKLCAEPHTLCSVLLLRAFNG